MKKSKTPFGIVYTAKNKITGAYYVGATTDSIQQRQSDHHERAKRGETYPFAQAIATYGTDAFVWEQVDTANTVNELAQKEKDYIIKFDSKRAGYNVDAGGGIKKNVYQYNLKNGSLIRQYDCLENAANAVNATKQSISRACLSVGKKYNGYYWSYDYKVPFEPDQDDRKKSVVQICPDDGTRNNYNSIAEASIKTGVNKSSIAKVCRGERKHAGGFFWMYS